MSEAAAPWLFQEEAVAVAASSLGQKAQEEVEGGEKARRIAEEEEALAPVSVPVRAVVSSLVGPTSAMTETTMPPETTSAFVGTMKAVATNTSSPPPRGITVRVRGMPTTATKEEAAAVAALEDEEAVVVVFRLLRCTVPPIHIPPTSLMVD
jgi:hypothetical protein